jgi:UDP:flavonoid glycosyltransferase YjiC (YdhE family)
VSTRQSDTCSFFVFSNSLRHRNGVPHVVLPSWTDCYEYAQRAEYLGIGRVGARKQVPKVEAGELSRELLTVLDGEESQSMKRKAQGLAAICKKKGDGADAVAHKMLELARKS